jgi:putative ATPase
MKANLANRVRPNKLQQIIGQTHLIQILAKMVQQQQVYSMILHGPSGTGKTTIALALMEELQLRYRLVNATTTNKKELDSIFEEASLFPGIIVIVDEIHRLNKDKQDLFLSHIEANRIILIGLTTINPYFSINPALRSRVLLLEVKRLTNDEVRTGVSSAINSKDGFNNQLKISNEALERIVNLANGDLRLALNYLEMASLVSEEEITIVTLNNYLTKSSIVNDKDGDGIYDLMSAFQKSIRGSDVNAALYYLALLIAANDIDALERRLLVVAYEDIGLANPNVVQKVINAVNTTRMIGYPEGQIVLSNIVIELALSPKSKTATYAIAAAMKQVETQAYPMPDYLKLTPLYLSDEERYDYDAQKNWPYIQYLPTAIKDIEFYQPEPSSPYEELLLNNYIKLRNIKKTNDLKSLKSLKK